MDSHECDRALPDLGSKHHNHPVRAVRQRDSGQHNEGIGPSGYAVRAKVINTTNTRTTLVVQLADLGDLILAAGAIQQLRSDRPPRHVTLLTKPSNMSFAKSIADAVVLADKHLYDSPAGLLRPRGWLQLFQLAALIRRSHFDEIVILHHLVTRWGALKFAMLTLVSGSPVRSGLDNGRGWFYTYAIKDRGFGAASEDEYWEELVGGAGNPALDVKGQDANELLRSHNVCGQFVAIHPGSGTYSLARRWPSHHFAALTDRLHDALGIPVVVVGGSEETELAEQITRGREAYTINLCGQTSFEALVGLLRQASLFVGNNAGVAQIAGLVDVPRVIIYGPTSPHTWEVQAPSVRTVRLDLACSPCLYRYQELGTPEGCATRECLFDLKPEMVLREALSVWDERRAA